MIASNLHGASQLKMRGLLDLNLLVGHEALDSCNVMSLSVLNQKFEK